MIRHIRNGETGTDKLACRNGSRWDRGNSRKCKDEWEPMKEASERWRVLENKMGAKHEVERWRTGMEDRKGAEMCKGA